MKLSVHKDQIIDGLQKAASIIPGKGGTAYLRSLWLNAADGYLSIMSSDANIEFTGKYPAEVSETGLVGVPGRAFCDLVRKMPSSVLNISVDNEEGSLLLARGKSKYHLPVTTPDWFQELAPYPSGEGVAWSGDFLLDTMEKVSFCIDTDDSRDALACFCLMPRGNGRIDACGLNGHQFAQLAFIHDELASRLPEKGLLIQKRYLQDIKKWLVPEDIELNLDDKRIYFKRMEAEEMLSLPRASSEYPDYNVFVSRLDSPDVSRLSIMRQEVVESLDRIQVFNTENQICVYMDLTENELALSAQGTDVGSASETLEAEYQGAISRIAFPTKNMLEIFNHFTSPRMNLTFTNAEGPCGITGADDNGYTVIIMPMKISQTEYDIEESE